MIAVHSMLSVCQHLNSSNSLNKVDHIIMCDILCPHTHIDLESSVGSGPLRVCPTVHSPSYERDCPGSAIKDQRTNYRMLSHTGGQCSSLHANHSSHGNANNFEQEVSGSLDQALKQLLSDL